MRPWRRSKARTSSTVTTASALPAILCEMSITTAGANNSRTVISGERRPSAMK
jgi:hypothetical protein